MHEYQLTILADDLRVHSRNYRLIYHNLIERITSNIEYLQVPFQLIHLMIAMNITADD